MNLYEVEESRAIIIPRDVTEANSAVKKYIIDKDTPVIGLDCEWKSRFASCPVALIQVATEEKSILFQICRFENKRRLPKLLSSILLDERIAKVGVGIEEDVRRILLQFLIPVRGWLDLRCLAVSKEFFPSLLVQQFQNFELKLSQDAPMSDSILKGKRSSFMPKLGLERLVADILHRSLPKLFKIQVLGNWEAFELPQDMKDYAAADAAASLDIFLGLDEARHCTLVNTDYNLRLLSVPSNDFSWRLVIEMPYIDGDVRQSCLDIISQNVLPQWRPILADHYKRSPSKKVKRSSKSHDRVSPSPLEKALNNQTPNYFQDSRLHKEANGTASGPSDHHLQLPEAIQPGFFQDVSFLPHNYQKDPPRYVPPPPPIVAINQNYRGPRHKKVKMSHKLSTTRSREFTLTRTIYNDSQEVNNSQSGSSDHYVQLRGPAEIMQPNFYQDVSFVPLSYQQPSPTFGLPPPPPGVPINQYHRDNVMFHPQFGLPALPQPQFLVQMPPLTPHSFT